MNDYRFVGFLILGNEHLHCEILVMHSVDLIGTFLQQLRTKVGFIIFQF